MSIRTRLARLEKAAGLADGRCPRCGFRPNDIHTIRIHRHPGSDWSNDTSGPPGPGWKPAPPRPTCPLCGGMVGPIGYVHVAADGSPWVHDRDRPRWGADTPEGSETFDEVAVDGDSP